LGPKRRKREVKAEKKKDVPAGGAATEGQKKWKGGGAYQKWVFRRKLGKTAKEQQ